MCVHVHVAALPAGVFTWVDRQAVHTRVYADATLACGGQLTATGRSLVDQALTLVGAEALATARPCPCPAD